MNSNYVIAIDGPAGAGKSTVAKRLAEELGLRYLDTGAMYRAVALAASREGIDAEDTEGAAQIARDIQIEFATGDANTIFVNGENVSGLIRTPEIGDLASALSTIGGVREALVAQQQAIVAHGGVVLEGRDATTVIAPRAEIKVYLTASLEERAKRRHLEYQDRGMPVSYVNVWKDVELRDHRDISREESPLTVAPDAHVIESGGHSVDEIVSMIAALVPTIR